MRGPMKEEEATELPPRLGEWPGRQPCHAEVDLHAEPGHAQQAAGRIQHHQATTTYNLLYLYSIRGPYPQGECRVGSVQQAEDSRVHKRGYGLHIAVPDSIGHSGVGGQSSLALQAAGPKLARKSV